MFLSWFVCGLGWDDFHDRCMLGFMMWWYDAMKCFDKNMLGFVMVDKHDRCMLGLKWNVMLYA